MSMAITRRKGTMTKRRKNGGFTLLELVCALFIITTAGFGALQLYHVGLARMAEMRDFDVAAELLRNEMEYLRSQPYEAVVSGNEFATSTPATESIYEVTPTVAVEEVAPGLKNVTLSVRWQSRNGRWHTRKLMSRIANHGGTGHVFVDLSPEGTS